MFHANLLARRFVAGCNALFSSSDSVTSSEDSSLWTQLLTLRCLVEHMASIHFLECSTPRDPDSTRCYLPITHVGCSTSLFRIHYFHSARKFDRGSMCPPVDQCLTGDKYTRLVYSRTRKSGRPKAKLRSFLRSENEDALYTTELLVKRLTHFIEKA